MDEFFYTYQDSKSGTTQQDILQIEEQSDGASRWLINMLAKLSKTHAGWMTDPSIVGRISIPRLTLCSTMLLCTRHRHQFVAPLAADIISFRRVQLCQGVRNIITGDASHMSGHLDQTNV